MNTRINNLEEMNMIACAIQDLDVQINRAEDNFFFSYLKGI